MSTKNQIIDLAEQLIRSRGYNGFSYSDISKPLEIKNAAVHYHFPAKEDLGLAVIQKTMEEFEKMKSNISTAPNQAKLERFIKIYTDNQKANLVCFMGALGSTFDSLPTNMQKALNASSIEIRQWLNEVLDQGLRNKEFHFSESVAQKTDVIISSLLASLVLNKVTGDNVLNNVLNSISKTI